MTPCVKKTWAPAGRTPVVPFRNRHHKKVSCLGAIAKAADGTLSVLADWYPGSYVRSAEAAAFAERLLRTFAGPVDLVWDNLSAHKSKPVRALVAAHPRLTVHHLPPYAPDLNPVEPLWGMTKYHRMANHTIDSLDELHAEAKRHVEAVGAEQRLLTACFASAELALTFSRRQ